MSETTAFLLVYLCTILLPIQGLILIRIVNLLRKNRMVLYNTMLLRNETLIARSKGRFSRNK